VGRALRDSRIGQWVEHHGMAQWVEHCREYELLTLNLAQNDTQVHDKEVLVIVIYRCAKLPRSLSMLWSI